MEHRALPFCVAGSGSSNRAPSAGRR